VGTLVPSPLSRSRGAPHRSSRRPAPFSTIGLHFGVIGLFLILSVIVWGHVWLTGHPTHTITLSLGDPGGETFWFAWLPWAILHGHNPFFTNALYAGRGGVNALANVSAMFPALILSPVTLLFGPIAAFNVAGTLSPVISGYFMFLLARKFTHFAPAQILAGLLWAFSPEVVLNLPFGHLSDVLGLFLPLTGLLAYDVVIEHKRRPWVDGVLFGTLVIAQFFTSTEVLAIDALCAPVGVAVGIALARRVLWNSRRALVTAAGAAIAVAAILLAYPVWFAVAGPRHITGPPWPFDYNAPLSGYLRWGVLVFIVVSIPVWRTRPLAWCAAFTGIWASMLSWGGTGTLIFEQGTHSSLWRPWSLFEHLPLFSNIETFRFSDVVAFCAAILMAISLDGWQKSATQKAAKRAKKRVQGPPRSLLALPVGIGIGATVAAFAALVPIAATYTLPLMEHSTPTPAWFTHEAIRLPQGTRVLTIPFTVNEVGPLLPLKLLGTEVMAYQAEDSFRFDLTGGYMVVPGTGGISVYRRPLGGTSEILTRLSDPGLSRPALSSNIAEVRTSLYRWEVQVAVIPQSARYPYAVRYLTAVYGRSPVEQRGAAVWYGTIRRSQALP